MSAWRREEFAGHTMQVLLCICKLASICIHWSYELGFCESESPQEMDVLSIC